MRKLLSLALLIALFAACNKPSHFPTEHALFGIVKPIKLSPKKTTIFLQDYIIDVKNIDSVSLSSDITKNPNKDNPDAIDLTYDNSKLPYYSTMLLWVKGFAYTLLLEKSDKISYLFKYNPQGKTYEKVGLAGDFNNWSPDNTPLKYKDSVWQTTLLLDPGRYQYLVVPDKTWIIDLNNSESTSNNMGGFNSVLKINAKKGEPLPVLYTNQINGDTIEIGFENNIDNVYIMWENFLVEDIVIDKPKKTIRFEIPEEAEDFSYSFIRAYSQNPSGKSNDLMIPLKNRKPITDYKDLTRSHKEAQILYFLMTDRFFNGNPENDGPIKDPEVAPAANFMGGDLQGITKKLKEGYFDSLKISTIWLSPVVQNPLKAYNEYPKPNRKFSGYHGYWPINSTQVDFRFGTAENLKELVETAHEKNINVILDFVANHVHEDNPIIKNNPKWATELNLPDGLNIRKWDEHRLTTWFDKFLPTFDFSQKVVIDTVAAIGLYWINEFNLDGFRHDATKHIPLEFWRAMTLKLKKDVMIPQNKSLLQIGETYGSRELIGSYVGNGLIDGQFDFNLYFDARSVFAIDNESFKKAANSLDQSFKSYGSNSLMGNITGNHDLPRFTSLASGDLKFNEDAKEVAWKRKIMVTDTLGYYKMAQFMAFNMTIPGIPVIYYGDETGMAGADDPDNRRMMNFDKLSNNEIQLKQKIQKLVDIRRNSMALNYGSFEWIKIDDKLLVYARKYFDKTVIVIMNKEKKAQDVVFNIPNHLSQKAFKANFNSSFSINNNSICIKMKPYSFEILD